MGHFVYAARAFDILDQVDSTMDYWEAKRGACVGVFQQLIHQHQEQSGTTTRPGSTTSATATTATTGTAMTVKPSDLQETLNMIRNTSNPQVEYITRIIKKWCKDNNIKMN